MSTATQRRRQASHLAAATVVALACLLAMLPAVLAASPHRLDGPITDDVNALDGNASDVQATLDDVQQATGTQLWIWYTDTLDGADAPGFATQTAQASGLGTTDLLLVIALDDRAYGYWKGDNVGISDADLDQVLSEDMEPALRSQDYVGAITETAAGLQKAIEGGEVTPEPPVNPGPTTVPDGGPTTVPDGVPSGDSGGGSPIGSLITALFIIGLVVGVGWWFLYVRPRGRAARDGVRRRRLERPERGPRRDEAQGPRRAREPHPRRDRRRDPRLGPGARVRPGAVRRRGGGAVRGRGRCGEGRPQGRLHDPPAARRFDAGGSRRPSGRC